jgi:hypothetical protein
MKAKIVAVMDGLAAIVEHRLFGLAVWVWIAVCTVIEHQVGMAVGVTLKTYLSGTWVKKGNGNGNEKTSNGSASTPGSGLHVGVNEPKGSAV